MRSHLLTKQPLTAASAGRRSIAGSALAFMAALVFLGACGDDTTPVNPDAAPSGPDAAPDAGLTLIGTVSVGDTTVEARIGGDTVASTVADANGGYRLEVSADDAQVVHVHASDGAAVTLASALADMATLRARAGADLELTPDELGTTNITPISTMRHAALLAANDSALPADREQMVAAEELITAVASSQELLEMAAALELVITSPNYDLPNGFANTLALAEDLHAMRRLVADIRTANANDDVIRSTLEAMLDDATMTGSFSAAKLPGTYYRNFIKHNNGFIGSGRSVLELDPAGTARFQQSNSTQRVQIPEPLTWSIDAASGNARLLTSREPTGQNLHSLLANADQLAELYPGDPNLQAQIRAAVGDSQVPVQFERIGAERRLVAEGIALDLVWETPYWHWVVSGPLADLGVNAPDVDRPAQSFGSAMLRDDAIAYQPLDEATVLGTWAMQMVTPADDDSLVDFFAEGDLLMTHALVTFASDGTATASGGMLEADMPMTWQPLADGRVQLTYPDGAQQIVGLWARQGPEYGLIATYSAPTGEAITGYWRAIKTDPSLVLDGTELHNLPDQYWKTTINIALSHADENGALPLREEFGFQFHADGTAHVISVLDWEDMPPELDIVTTDDWRLDAGDVVLNWWLDENAQSHCDPANNNCFASRERTWTPLAQDGALLYVLEDYAAQADRFQMQWDAVDMRWEIDGVPADLDAREYLFAPRLNAYSIDDIPVL